MSRRSALAPAAHADGPGGGSSGSSGSSGSGPAGAAGAAPASTGSSKPTDKCSYALVDPQPPPGHLAWKGNEPADGAVYKVQCVMVCRGVAVESRHFDVSGVAVVTC
ncbi:hypothetical protein ACYCCF_31010 [Streptomyces argenteolus]|uniref:hypothetical protein n=1 Tax=Streptomyces sp. NPDC025273 TaxID=3155251 RepID=UPI0033FDA08A